MASLVKAGKNRRVNAVWKARVQTATGERFLGYYPTEDDAQMAELRMRIELGMDTWSDREIIRLRRLLEYEV